MPRTIDLPLPESGRLRLTAYAEDRQGNTEQMPHVLDYHAPTSSRPQAPELSSASGS